LAYQSPAATPQNKSQKEKETIYNAVETLELFPNCANVKKLSNRNDYRLRVAK